MSDHDDLTQFEVEDNGDGQLFLVHRPCTDRVCEVEHNDTLAVLMGTAQDHAKTCLA